MNTIKAIFLVILGFIIGHGLSTIRPVNTEIQQELLRYENLCTPGFTIDFRYTERKTLMEIKCNLGSKIFEIIEVE